MEWLPCASKYDFEESLLERYDNQLAELEVWVRIISSLFYLRSSARMRSDVATKSSLQ